MQQPDDDITWCEDVDFHRVFSQLMEARAAARTLYELFPNRSAIDPLYKYLDDALREIWEKLVEIQGRSHC